MTDLRSLKDRLSHIHDDESQEGKEMIPDDELSGAYEALREVIPQMDYDSVEMIVSQVREFRLPDEDNKKFSELEKLMKTLDWDGMESLIGKI